MNATVCDGLGRYAAVGNEVCSQCAHCKRGATERLVGAEHLYAVHSVIKPYTQRQGHRIESRAGNRCHVRDVGISQRDAVYAVGDRQGDGGVRWASGADLCAVVCPHAVTRCGVNEGETEEPRAVEWCPVHHNVTLMRDGKRHFGPWRSHPEKTKNHNCQHTSKLHSVSSAAFACPDISQVRQG